MRYSRQEIERRHRKKKIRGTMVATVIAGENRRDGAAIDERALRGDPVGDARLSDAGDTDPEFEQRAGDRQQERPRAREKRRRAGTKPRASRRTLMMPSLSSQSAPHPTGGRKDL